ncbi:uncharacterized protein LOC117215101, partial [Bombus bifarius]|uniref:Uncharacterized protein LOC117215101 n=1 Tax=Bombus bifarius TaxID=103933 RepID=A0A6P8MUB6_9HYME
MFPQINQIFRPKGQSSIPPLKLPPEETSLIQEAGITIHNTTKDIEGTWKKIEERVDGREEEVVIIGGDWNARTGEEGGSINEDVGKEKNRRSKDKTINMEGRTLLKIINGSDKEGEERTYIGERGNSVIDYVIGNQEATEEIIYMKIGKRTESGHMPLEIKYI